MAEKEQLDKKTQEIDRLINKTNSGKNAWKAGSLLLEIKVTKEYEVNNFANFEAYITTALRISRTKADSYINIYKIYSEDDIGNLTLVTHLYELTQTDQDIRELILEKAKKIDEQKINKNEVDSIDLFGDNSQKQLIQKTEMLPDYNTEIITTTIKLLDSAKTNRIPLNEKLTNEAFEYSASIYDRKKDLENKKIPNRTGQKLNSDYFEEVKMLFPYEPTNEMGLVALFCTMFFKLKGRTFQFGKQELSFQYIDYVRAEFPDAKITFLNLKTNYLTNLKIEFEFNSESFITHQHIKSKERCELIICWENNLSNKRLAQFGYEFPPIISLKELLATNKLVLS
jgi:hypothetical protein